MPKLKLREIPTNYEIREEGGDLIIEGYFAVFNSVYQITPDMSEEIAPGAFSGSLHGDVRALINHDTTLVVGRTTAGTLSLREDEHGLWGSIKINPKDSDATNVHARVERRDVDQCSIGFEIVKEDTEIREDGSIHWTIREVKLHEVSICTFPAYEQTDISARAAERDAIKKRTGEAWAEKMRARLGGD